MSKYICDPTKYHDGRCGRVDDPRFPKMKSAATCRCGCWPQGYCQDWVIAEGDWNTMSGGHLNIEYDSRIPTDVGGLDKV